MTTETTFIPLGINIESDPEKLTPGERSYLDDLKAAHRLGASFGLDPYEVMEALMVKMHAKRLAETEHRIGEALGSGVVK